MEIEAGSVIEKLRIQLSEAQYQLAIEQARSEKLQQILNQKEDGGDEA